MDMAGNVCNILNGVLYSQIWKPQIEREDVWIGFKILVSV